MPTPPTKAPAKASTPAANKPLATVAASKQPAQSLARTASTTRVSTPSVSGGSTASGLFKDKASISGVEKTSMTNTTKSGTVYFTQSWKVTTL